MADVSNYELYFTIAHVALGLFSLMGIVSIATTMLIKPEVITHVEQRIVYRTGMDRLAVSHILRPDYELQRRVDPKRYREDVERDMRKQLADMVAKSTTVFEMAPSWRNTYNTELRAEIGIVRLDSRG